MSEGLSLPEQLERPRTGASVAMSVAESALNTGAKLIETLVREGQAINTPAQPSEAETAERKRLQALKDKMQLEEARDELKLINYPQEQARKIILGKEDEAEPTPVANARTEYQSLLDKIAPQGSPTEPQRPVSMEPRDFVQQQAMGVKSAIGAAPRTETVSAPLPLQSKTPAAG